MLPVISIFLGDLVFVGLLGISKQEEIKKNVDDTIIRNNFLLSVIGGTFWMYFSYSNIFLAYWITFFVRIYVLVLKSILREVDNHSVAVKMFHQKGNYNFGCGKLKEASDAYDILIKMVTIFNDAFGIRLLIDVGAYISWTLGCTYFAIVSWKMRQFGSCATNVFSSLVALYALYMYGNHGEILNQTKGKLFVQLSQIRTQNLQKMERAEVKKCA